MRGRLLQRGELFFPRVLEPRTQRIQIQSWWKPWQWPSSGQLSKKLPAEKLGLVPLPPAHGRGDAPGQSLENTSHGGQSPFGGHGERVYKLFLVWKEKSRTALQKILVLPNSPAENTGGGKKAALPEIKTPKYSSSKVKSKSL